MQILCGLQVVFFLFNCQTPAHSSFLYTVLIIIMCGESFKGTYPGTGLKNACNISESVV